MRVVEAVAARQDAVSAKYVQRVTGLERATTYHLLRTLVHDGYLVRDEDGNYRTGPRLLSVTSRRDRAALAVRARPTLESLSRVSGCSAYLAVARDGSFELIDLVENPQAGHVELWVSLDSAVHATALGKALLATLTDVERRDVIEGRDLPALTRATITDPKVLQSVVGGITGPALDDGEYLDGVSCIAEATRVGCESIAIGLSGPKPALRAARVLLGQSVVSLAIA